MEDPAIIHIHTPSDSIVLFHSGEIFRKCYIQVHLIHSPVENDSLTSLFDKLNQRPEFYGKGVGPGWLKFQSSGMTVCLSNGVFQCLFISVTAWTLGR
jgi:hypothetical protein